MPRSSRALRGGLLLAAALLAGGCEWFSTMSDPATIQPHERQPLLPADHAVALDGLPEFDFATADQVLQDPRPATPARVRSGAAYYQAFCAVCHGATGDGKGPISGQFPAIPAINTPRVAGYTDAYLFTLISKGRGLMPDYGRILPPARWDVIAYLRTMPTAGGTAQP